MGLFTFEHLYVTHFPYFKTQLSKSLSVLNFTPLLSRKLLLSLLIKGQGVCFSFFRMIFFSRFILLGSYIGLDKNFSGNFFFSTSLLFQFSPLIPLVKKVVKNSLLTVHIHFWLRGLLFGLQHLLVHEFLENKHTLEIQH